MERRIAYVAWTIFLIELVILIWLPAIMLWLRG